MNILLLVLDACRTDYFEEYAENLMGHTAGNLVFENAISPGRWSMPSHASLFTGRYPHEHGLTTDRDTFDTVPLVDALDKRGFTTYGVSANPFAGPMTGFDDPFDDFTYTLSGYDQAGINVKDTIQRLDGAESVVGAVSNGLNLLWAALRHDHPTRSIHNVGIQAIRSMVDHFDSLQRIPHPRFHQSGVFSYSPTSYTERIESIIETQAHTESRGPSFRTTWIPIDRTIRLSGSGIGCWIGQRGIGRSSE